MLRHRLAPSRFLVLLLCLCQLVGSAWAAQEDGHLLKLLQPASRSAMDGWLDAHERLADLVQQAAGGGGVDVLIYGDSIMEAFKAQSVGYDASDKYRANKEVWDRDAPPRSLVLGIAGDQAVHLLWRLQHGEGPQGLSPRHILLMIGTNDVAHLSSVHRYDAALIGHIIALGVQQCVRELQRQAPQATITVLGVLPLEPMMLHVPQRIFGAMVDAANAELDGFAAAQANPRLRFRDCGRGFKRPDGSLNFDLMPDGVHPSGYHGADRLLHCIKDAIAA